MVEIQLILIVLLLYSLVIFKDILLKLVVLIIWYPLLVLYLFGRGVPMTGIIDMYQDSFNADIISYAINAYIVGLYLFLAILWKIRNVQIQILKLSISSRLRIFIFFLTVISSTFLLNIHEEGDSLKSATLYLSLSTILLTTHSKRDLIWLLHCVLCLYLILKGERVDSVMIVVLLFLSTRGSSEVEGTDLNWKKVLIFAPAFFILLVLVGFVREDSDEVVTSNMIISSFYSQRTVTDVVYIYLTSVKYYLMSGPHYEVLNNLFFGLIPGEYGGVVSPYNYTIYLKRFMPNPGGGLFFTEGTICFGWFGPILYLIVYAVLLKRMLKKRTSTITQLIFTLLLVMQCRVIWYGMIYLYKPLLFVLLLYFIAAKSKWICKKGNS